ENGVTIEALQKLPVRPSETADSSTSGPSGKWDEFRKLMQQAEARDQEYKAKCEALSQRIAQLKKDVATYLEDVDKHVKAVDNRIEKSKKRRAELNARVDALDHHILRVETQFALILTYLVADERARSGVLDDGRAPTPLPRQSRQGRDGAPSSKRGRSSYDLQ
ncbi:MAG: hypothetical protein SGARI_002329, partial [Bacillariaceae sp.]